MSMNSTSSGDSIPLPPPGSAQFNDGQTFFSGAQGFHIGQQNNIVNHYGAQESDLHFLLRPIHDASYTRNRKLSPPDSTCLPGTRDNLIKRINSWADKNVFLSARHVMWTHGYVGCGKSSLAQAVAESYAEKERLVGSFFFFRGTGERSSTARFAGTLACQLAAAVPETVPHIQKALKTNPEILTSCTVDTQFQRLVYDPLVKATKLDIRKSARYHNPYIIVLDGVDECEDHGGIATFIDHMLQFFKKNPRVPLRFFITSRVEEHIRTRLDSDLVHMMNLVDNTSLEDVAAVADATFALAAKHDRVIQAYGGNWPSPEDRKTLAEHAGGSLIFMSTILKFILGPSEDGLTSMQRLPLALDINPGLDGFYTQTLSRSEQLPHFSDIIATVILFVEPPSIIRIAEALGTPSFEVVRVLVNLHAILQVPGDNETPVTICHTSLRDFLNTEQRSGRFWISPAVQDRVYQRVFARCESISRFLDITTTVTLAMEPLCALQVADLLSIEPPQVTQALSGLHSIIKLPTDVQSPIVFPTPIRHFLRTESRSGTFYASPEHHELLAYACFELVALPLRRAAAQYSQAHAVGHWLSYLKICTNNGGGDQLSEVLSHLRSTFTAGAVNVIMAVLIAADYAYFHFSEPNWSMPLLGQALHARIDPDHTKLIASVLLAFTHTTQYRPLTSVKPNIVDDLLWKASWDDVRDVVQATFVLATQNASPSLDPWNWEPVQSLLQSLFDLYGGSLMFACHFISFALELKRQFGRPPPVRRNSAESLVDTSLDGLYYRILSFAEQLPHFHDFATTTSLLEVPFTICQLSDLLRISTSAIRRILVRMRGIIYVPDDNMTDIVFSPFLREFMRDETRAGNFFAGPSSHAALARRCTELLAEGNGRPSPHPRSLSSYAAKYHLFHSQASSRNLRRSTT